MVKNASWWITVRGIIMVILLPLLSNGLATFIGLLTHKMALKLKCYSIIQTIIIIILTGGYLIANFSIQGFLMDLTGTVDEIKGKMWVIKVLLEFILEGKVLGFLIIASIIIIVYYFGLVVIRKQLGKLDKRLDGGNAKIFYKTTSPFKSLIKKEL